MDKELFLKNLKKKGYTVSCFASREEAASYLDKAIDGVSVGMASSATLDALEIYDRLKTHNETWWHWRVPEGMSDKDVRYKEREADIYLSSVNGAAQSGELINIDNTGNRVSEIAYGHKKVYLVLGKNKLTETLEEAIARARNIAAPLNIRRMHRTGTPCAYGDHCYDCQSAERICRILMVLWERPRGAEYEIVYIDEDLGF